VPIHFPAQEFSVTGLAADIRAPSVSAGSAEPVTKAPSSEGLATTLRRVAICVALYAIPVKALAAPIADLDIWWHLRTGQWVLEHGTVPTTDPFSSFGHDRAWRAYSWLFEVLAYGHYWLFGLPGLLILRVALAMLALVMLHRFVIRREPRFIAATALTAAAFLALAPLQSERPWQFSILFSVLTLEAILALREGRETWAIWLLPVCYALWANLHIQFVYGLLLLGIACAAPVLDAVLRRERSHTAATAGTRGWWQLVGLTVVCLLATLVNPYHLGIYNVVVDYGTQSKSYDLITELQAPRFRSASDWALLGLVVLAVFVLGRARQLSSFPVLLLAATGYFSFHSARDAWFVVLASVATITTRDPLAQKHPQEWLLTRRRVLAVAPGVAAVMVGAAVWRGLLPQPIEADVRSLFPAEAAEFVERQGYAGPLYNEINWGGYLIWRLPGLPVGLDPRMNVHGDDRIARHVLTRGGARGWESDAELAAANVIIVEVNSALAELLRTDPRFELAHEDGVAVVFVARGSG
jgi:hypothetical protein